MQYDVTLTRRTLVAEGTWELDFDLQGAAIDFSAGQYCRIELPTLDREDRKNSRKFSIVNAPHDNRRLVVVTRAGSTGYKCTFCALPPGAPATARKVKGAFLLPDRPPRPLVFIAGGIGIAPFMSMLRDLDHRDRLADVTLLYFNRSPATTAYLSELEHLAARRTGFHLVPSMTRHPEWSGTTARLTTELLTGLFDAPEDHDYYVVGTSPMVAAALQTLDENGVPKRQVHDEDFSGYDRLRPIASNGR